jgi:hypothetical protein
MLNELYRMAFRKKIYRTLDDHRLQEYNEQQSHQARWCYGKTPLQTFAYNVPLARRKC